MLATYASAVSFTDMINGLIEVGIFGEGSKSLFQLVAISVRLSDPEMLIPIVGDSQQIFFG